MVPTSASAVLLAVVLGSRPIVLIANDAAVDGKLGRPYYDGLPQMFDIQDVAITSISFLYMLYYRFPIANLQWSIN